MRSSSSLACPRSRSVSRRSSPLRTTPSAATPGRLTTAVRVNQRLLPKLRAAGVQLLKSGRLKNIGSLLDSQEAGVVYSGCELVLWLMAKLDPVVSYIENSRSTRCARLNDPGRFEANDLPVNKRPGNKFDPVRVNDPVW